MRFCVGAGFAIGTETVRMPLSYIALMWSSSAPVGSKTARSNEP